MKVGVARVWPSQCGWEQRNDEREAQNGMRVLLVEDSHTQAEYFRDILEESGLEVDWVEDGQVALEVAYESLPDLIVLDVNLPSLNGFQICSRLKRDQATQHIPVIMLTSRDAAKDAMTGLQAGAEDYIAKDEFAGETLQASLHQLGII